jgi:CelD/BcsL family acetyltransferase involved in cellulose biosynthesis
MVTLNKMEIRHIRSLEEFESLQDQWDELLSSCSKQTVFLTWEWLTAWWKHWQAGRELWLITAWSEGKLVGAAPLMRTTVRRYGLKYRLIHSLGAPNTDESDFLTHSDDTEEILKILCDYLLSQRGQWDALELNEFHLEIPTAKFIGNYFTERGCVIRSKPNIHYHIPIAGTWDEYWKKLSKNLRHNIERRLRRVQENHQLNFQVIEGREATWSDFEAIFAMNARGNYPEKYKPEQERNFHRELMERMRNRNWIRIAILRFDGQPVAYDYGFAVHGKFEDWRTGFDLQYADWAGGTLMLYFELKYLFTEQYQDLDFLRGEYTYKDKWAPATREFVELRIVQPHKLSARLALMWMPNLWNWIKSKRKRKSGKE